MAGATSMFNDFAIFGHKSFTNPRLSLILATISSIATFSIYSGGFTYPSLQRIGTSFAAILGFVSANVFIGNKTKDD